MAHNFEKVQEWKDGVVLDDEGRAFVNVIQDHILLYGQVCTDAKESQPYSQFHRMLRSLSWDVAEQLDQLKKFLIEVAEYEAKDAN